jgi:hypothetical protein
MGLYPLPFTEVMHASVNDLLQARCHEQACRHDRTISLMPDLYPPGYPEIFLLTMACVILLVDLFVKDSRRHLTCTVPADPGRLRDAITSSPPCPADLTTPSATCSSTT